MSQTFGSHILIIFHENTEFLKRTVLFKAVGQSNFMSFFNCINFLIALKYIVSNNIMIIMLVALFFEIYILYFLISFLNKIWQLSLAKHNLYVFIIAFRKRFSFKGTSCFINTKWITIIVLETIEDKRSRFTVCFQFTTTMVLMMSFYCIRFNFHISIHSRLTYLLCLFLKIAALLNYLSLDSSIDSHFINNYANGISLLVIVFE